MSFTGFSRGRKRLYTIRLVHAGAGSSTISVNDSAPSPLTITAGNWVQLVASLSQNINLVEIFDSTGETARLGTGLVSVEEDLMLIVPGGNGAVPVRIDASKRLVIQAEVTPVANTETIINLYD